MVETVPADIYEGDHRLYIESLGEFFIEIINSTLYDPSDYWEEDDGELQVTTNESTANFAQQYYVDMGEKVADNLTVQLVKRNGTHFLIGDSENIPAYSPFYVYHTNLENVYEVRHAWGGAEFEADSFLGESEYEDSALVKNISTGQARPIENETFKRQLDSGVLKYALPID